MKSKQDCLVVLHRLGINEGDVVYLHHHDDLNHLIGAGATMIEALLEALGEEGTLVMSQNIQINQDPSLDSTISFDQREKMRQELVDFDFKKYRETTYNPTFLALTKTQNRLFNNHPKIIVCAVGKYAKLMTKGQPLDFPYGKESMFESLRQLDGKILHFSEDYSDMDELRLAYENKPIQSIGSVGCVLGGQWTKYNDYQMDRSYYQSLEDCDKKEVKSKEKMIQCFNYSGALNHFSKQHPVLFLELGQ